jgi:dUTP pyrophosphatase
MVKLSVKKLSEDAKIPSYATEGDAGMDIYANEDIVVEPGKRVLVSTGISASFPKGYVALVWDKSGHAVKRGIKTMAGVIDAGYRGEWKIALYNTSEENFEIKKHDKIAQVLIQPVKSAEIEEVSELSDTERGEGGFGSTGVQ